MPQAGYTPIELYYSATASNIPSASNLNYGELAINIADGTLWYKNSSGIVKLLAATLLPTLSGGTGVAGTLTGYVYGNGLSPMTASTTIPGTAIGSDISYNAANVNGTVAIAHGGTNVTTTPSNGQLLIGNGSGYTLATLSAGTNVTITNTAGGISIAASGGSGGGTVTSVGTSGSVNGITLTGGPITTSGTVTLGGALSGVSLTSQVSGVLPVANGGTNVTTTPSNGQLLIGNGSGYTLATLSAGTNIAITNTPGGISIAASGVLPVANGGTGSSLAPQFAAYQATAQSISNNTSTVVHYDNVRWDTNSGWNASTFTYTPGVPGYYQVNVSVTMSFTSAPASSFQIAAGINKVVGGTPTLFDYNEISSPAMSGNITPFCASVVQLTNASDGIQGVVLQSSGATYSTYSGGTPQTTISVAFIRGI